MAYQYELIYDTYDNNKEEFLLKINLGDSKIFQDNIRFENILDESEARVCRKLWKSKFNDYVVYEHQPLEDVYNTVYELAFKNEYSRNYFIYLLDKYYLDLNYYENIYNTKALIKAGSKEDR